MKKLINEFKRKVSIFNQKKMQNKFVPEIKSFKRKKIVIFVPEIKR